jgi:hypothetical protein
MHAICIHYIYIEVRLRVRRARQTGGRFTVRGRMRGGSTRGGRGEAGGWDLKPPYGPPYFISPRFPHISQKRQGRGGGAGGGGEGEGSEGAKGGGVNVREGGRVPLY